MDIIRNIYILLFLGDFIGNEYDLRQVSGYNYSGKTLELDEELIKLRDPADCKTLCGSTEVRVTRPGFMRNMDW